MGLMKELIGCEINEKDIATAVRCLKTHDPANANDEYAIQMLELMHEIAKRVASAGLEFSELFLGALKEKKVCSGMSVIKVIRAQNTLEKIIP